MRCCRIFINRVGCIVVALLWCSVVWGGAATNATAPRSFAYVLQTEHLGSREEAIRRLANCRCDWLVIDPSYDGSAAGRWQRAEIAALTTGTVRRVLAYLSIGEAENYRAYWRREWDVNRRGHPDAGSPQWPCGQNPEWAGNYRVRYWDKEWQAIILQEVDRIVAAGFDGLYLDIVDAFEFFEYDPQKKEYLDDRRNPDSGQSFRQDMIEWVVRIATHLSCS